MYFALHHNNNNTANTGTGEGTEDTPLADAHAAAATTTEDNNNTTASPPTLTDDTTGASYRATIYNSSISDDPPAPATTNTNNNNNNTVNTAANSSTNSSSSTQPVVPAPINLSQQLALLAHTGDTDTHDVASVLLHPSLDAEVFTRDCYALSYLRNRIECLTVLALGLGVDDMTQYNREYHKGYASRLQQQHSQQQPLLSSVAHMSRASRSLRLRGDLDKAMECLSLKQGQLAGQLPHHSTSEDENNNSHENNNNITDDSSTRLLDKQKKNEAEAAAARRLARYRKYLSLVHPREACGELLWKRLNPGAAAAAAVLNSTNNNNNNKDDTTSTTLPPVPVPLHKQHNAALASSLADVAALYLCHHNRHRGGAGSGAGAFSAASCGEILRSAVASEVGRVEPEAIFVAQQRLEEYKVLYQRQQTSPRQQQQQQEGVSQEENSGSPHPTNPAGSSRHQRCTAITFGGHADTTDDPTSAAIQSFLTGNSNAHVETDEEEEEEEGTTTVAEAEENDGGESATAPAAARIPEESSNDNSSGSGIKRRKKKKPTVGLGGITILDVPHRSSGQGETSTSTSTSGSGAGATASANDTTNIGTRAPSGTVEHTTSSSSAASTYSVMRMTEAYIYVLLVELLGVEGDGELPPCNCGSGSSGPSLGTSPHGPQTPTKLSTPPTSSIPTSDDAARREYHRMLQVGAALSRRFDGDEDPCQEDNNNNTRPRGGSASPRRHGGYSLLDDDDEEIIPTQSCSSGSSPSLPTTAATPASPGPSSAAAAAAATRERNCEAADAQLHHCCLLLCSYLVATADIVRVVERLAASPVVDTAEKLPPVDSPEAVEFAQSLRRCTSSSHLKDNTGTTVTLPSGPPPLSPALREHYDWLCDVLDLLLSRPLLLPSLDDDATRSRRGRTKVTGTSERVRHHIGQVILIAVTERRDVGELLLIILGNALRSLAMQGTPATSTSTTATTGATAYPLTTVTSIAAVVDTLLTNEILDTTTTTDNNRGERLQSIAVEGLIGGHLWGSTAMPNNSSPTPTTPGADDTGGFTDGDSGGIKGTEQPKGPNALRNPLLPPRGWWKERGHASLLEYALERYPYYNCTSVPLMEEEDDEGCFEFPMEGNGEDGSPIPYRTSDRDTTAPPHTVVGSSASPPRRELGSGDNHSSRTHSARSTHSNKSTGSGIHLDTHTTTSQQHQRTASSGSSHATTDTKAGEDQSREEETPSQQQQQHEDEEGHHHIHPLLVAAAAEEEKIRRRIHRTMQRNDALAAEAAEAEQLAGIILSLVVENGATVGPSTMLGATTAPATTCPVPVPAPAAEGWFSNVIPALTTLTSGANNRWWSDATLARSVSPTQEKEFCNLYSEDTTAGTEELVALLQGEQGLFCDEGSWTAQGSCGDTTGLLTFGYHRSCGSPAQHSRAEHTAPYTSTSSMGSSAGQFGSFGGVPDLDGGKWPPAMSSSPAYNNNFNNINNRIARSGGFEESEEDSSPTGKEAVIDPIGTALQEQRKAQHHQHQSPAHHFQSPRSGNASSNTSIGSAGALLDVPMTSSLTRSMSNRSARARDELDIESSDESDDNNNGNEKIIADNGLGNIVIETVVESKEEEPGENNTNENNDDEEEASSSAPPLPSFGSAFTQLVTQPTDTPIPATVVDPNVKLPTRSRNPFKNYCKSLSSEGENVRMVTAKPSGEGAADTATGAEAYVVTLDEGGLVEDSLIEHNLTPEEAKKFWSTGECLEVLETITASRRTPRGAHSSTSSHGGESPQSMRAGASPAHSQNASISSSSRSSLDGGSIHHNKRVGSDNKLLLKSPVGSSYNVNAAVASKEPKRRTTLSIGTSDDDDQDSNNKDKDKDKEVFPFSVDENEDLERAVGPLAGRKTPPTLTIPSGGSEGISSETTASDVAADPDHSADYTPTPRPGTASSCGTNSTPIIPVNGGMFDSVDNDNNEEEGNNNPVGLQGKERCTELDLDSDEDAEDEEDTLNARVSGGGNDDDDDDDMLAKPFSGVRRDEDDDDEDAFSKPITGGALRIAQEQDDDMADLLEGRSGNDISAALRELAESMAAEKASGRLLLSRNGRKRLVRAIIGAVEGATTTTTAGTRPLAPLLGNDGTVADAVPERSILSQLLGKYNNTTNNKKGNTVSSMHYYQRGGRSVFSRLRRDQSHLSRHQTPLDHLIEQLLCYNADAHGGVCGEEYDDENNNNKHHRRHRRTRQRRHSTSYIESAAPPPGCPPTSSLARTNARTTVLSLLHVAITVCCAEMNDYATNGSTIAAAAVVQQLHQRAAERQDAAEAAALQERRMMMYGIISDNTTNNNINNTSATNTTPTSTPAMAPCARNQQNNNNDECEASVPPLSIQALSGVRSASRRASVVSTARTNNTTVSPRLAPSSFCSATPRTLLNTNTTSGTADMLLAAAETLAWGAGNGLVINSGVLNNSTNNNTTAASVSPRSALGARQGSDPFGSYASLDVQQQQQQQHQRGNTPSNYPNSAGGGSCSSGTTTPIAAALSPLEAITQSIIQAAEQRTAAMVAAATPRASLCSANSARVTISRQQSTCSISGANNSTNNINGEQQQGSPFIGEMQQSASSKGLKLDLGGAFRRRSRSVVVQLSTSPMKAVPPTGTATTTGAGPGTGGEACSPSSPDGMPSMPTSRPADASPGGETEQQQQQQKPVPSTTTPLTEDHNNSISSAKWGSVEHSPRSRFTVTSTKNRCVSSASNNTTTNYNSTTATGSGTQGSTSQPESSPTSQSNNASNAVTPLLTSPSASPAIWEATETTHSTGTPSAPLPTFSAVSVDAQQQQQTQIQPRPLRPNTATPTTTPIIRPAPRRVSLTAALCDVTTVLPPLDHPYAHSVPSVLFAHYLWQIVDTLGNAVALLLRGTRLHGKDNRYYSSTDKKTGKKARRRRPIPLPPAANSVVLNKLAEVLLHTHLVIRQHRTAIAETLHDTYPTQYAEDGSYIGAEYRIGITPRLNPRSGKNNNNKDNTTTTENNNTQSLMGLGTSSGASVSLAGGDTATSATALMLMKLANNSNTIGNNNTVGTESVGSTQSFGLGTAPTVSPTPVSAADRKRRRRQSLILLASSIHAQLHASANSLASTNNTGGAPLGASGIDNVAGSSVSHNSPILPRQRAATVMGHTGSTSDSPRTESIASLGATGGMNAAAATFMNAVMRSPRGENNNNNKETKDSPVVTSLGAPQPSSGGPFTNTTATTSSNCNNNNYYSSNAFSSESVTPAPLRGGTPEGGVDLSPAGILQYGPVPFQLLRLYDKVGARLALALLEGLRGESDDEEEEDESDTGDNKEANRRKANKTTKRDTTHTQAHDNTSGNSSSYGDDSYGTSDGSLDEDGSIAPMCNENAMPIFVVPPPNPYEADLAAFSEVIFARMISEYKEHIPSELLTVSEQERMRRWEHQRYKESSMSLQRNSNTNNNAIINSYKDGELGRARSGSHGSSHPGRYYRPSITTTLHTNVYRPLHPGDVKLLRGETLMESNDNDNAGGLYNGGRSYQIKATSPYYRSEDEDGLSGGVLTRGRLPVTLPPSHVLKVVDLDEGDSAEKTTPPFNFTSAENANTASLEGQTESAATAAALQRCLEAKAALMQMQQRLVPTRITDYTTIDPATGTLPYTYSLHNENECNNNIIHTSSSDDDEDKNDTEEGNADAEGRATMETESAPRSSESSVPLPVRRRSLEGLSPLQAAVLEETSKDNPTPGLCSPGVPAECIETSHGSPALTGEVLTHRLRPRQRSSLDGSSSLDNSSSAEAEGRASSPGGTGVIIAPADTSLFSVVVPPQQQPQTQQPHQQAQQRNALPARLPPVVKSTDTAQQSLDLFGPPSSERAPVAPLCGNSTSPRRVTTAIAATALRGPRSSGGSSVDRVNDDVEDESKLPLALQRVPTPPGNPNPRPGSQSSCGRSLQSEYTVNNPGGRSIISTFSSASTPNITSDVAAPNSPPLWAHRTSSGTVIAANNNARAMQMALAPGSAGSSTSSLPDLRFLHQPQGNISSGSSSSSGYTPHQPNSASPTATTPHAKTITLPALSSNMRHQPLHQQQPSQRQQQPQSLISQRSPSQDDSVITTSSTNANNKNRRSNERDYSTIRPRSE